MVSYPVEDWVLPRYRTPKCLECLLGAAQPPLPEQVCVFIVTLDKRFFSKSTVPPLDVSQQSQTLLPTCLMCLPLMFSFLIFSICVCPRREALLNSALPYPIIPYQTQLNPTPPYHTLPDLTRPYPTRHDLTQPDPTLPYQTKPDLTRPY